MRFLFLLAALACCSSPTASGEGVDAGDASAAHDASTTDSSAPSDGGGGCGATFCSAHASATFCADFDEGSATVGWSVDTTGAAQAITSDAESTSCPSSLEVDIPMNDVVTQRAWLQKTLPAAADMTVDLDVLFPNLTSTSSDGFGILLLRGSSDTSWSITVDRTNAGAWLLQVHQGAAQVQSAPLNPLLNAWNHMTLTVHFVSDATGEATLSYRDATNATVTATVSQQPTLPPSATGSALFALGASPSSMTSKAWSFEFDSVVIE